MSQTTPPPTYLIDEQYDEFVILIYRRQITNKNKKSPRILSCKLKEHFTRTPTIGLA